MLRKYPDAAKHADRDGLLPIHIAAHNPAPEARDLVDVLLCVHLEGAKVEDKDGLLPLHYACKNLGEEVKRIFIDALLTANPDAAVKGDITPTNSDSPINFKKLSLHRDTITQTHQGILLSSLN